MLQKFGNILVCSTVFLYAPLVGSGVLGCFGLADGRKRKLLLGERRGTIVRGFDGRQRARSEDCVDGVCVWTVTSLFVVAHAGVITSRVGCIHTSRPLFSGFRQKDLTKPYVVFENRYKV